MDLLSKFYIFDMIYLRWNIRNQIKQPMLDSTERQVLEGYLNIDQCGVIIV